MTNPKRGQLAGWLSAFALALTPIAAQAEGLAGQVGFGGAVTSLDSEEIWSLTGGGSVATPIIEGLGGQVDLFGSGLFNKDTESVGAVNAGVHLYHRNEQFLAGIGSTFIDGEGSEAFFYDVRLETQYYLPNQTVDFSFGFLDGDNVPQHVWGGNLGIEHFCNDGLSAEAGISWFTLPAGGVSDIGSLAVGVNYIIPETPLQLHAGYSYTLPFDDTSLDAHVGSIGIEYLFGQTTLPGRSRKGASLAPGLGVFSGILSF